MPTLNDLHAALDATANDAPTAQEMLTRLDDRGHHRWRAPLLMAAAVVIVVAVVVPTTMLRSQDHRTTAAPINTPAATRTPSQPSPAASPTTRATGPVSKRPVPTSFRYDFQFRNVAPLHFAYDGILSDRQVAEVYYSAGSGGDATVQVYNEGAFAPALVARGTPTTINGHVGYVARVADPDDPLDPTKRLTVAWRYADNSWALVSASDPRTKSAAKIISVAKLVLPGRTAAVRIPFKVGYLPPGVVRQSVGPGTDDAIVGFTDGGEPDPQMGPFSGIGDAFEVDVRGIDQCDVLCTVNSKGHAHVDRQGGYSIDLGVPVKVNGQRAFYSARTGGVTVLGHDWYYTVGFSGGGPNRFTRSQLVAVARGITVASRFTDPTTWYDAETAIPS